MQKGKRSLPLTLRCTLEDLHQRLLEFFGSVVIHHTCYSNVSTTLWSGRNANICKEYVCFVPADFVFEIFRGVSLFGADRNTSNYAKRNGNLFVYKTINFCT